jgi:hypothetical protein
MGGVFGRALYICLLEQDLKVVVVETLFTGQMILNLSWTMAAGLL